MTHLAKETWSLAELAEETGISPRTIRYYISRGLLDGPTVAGRGAAYGKDHLARLRAIQELQGQGAMLSEIGRLLEGGPPQDSLPSPESWKAYPLERDVLVWVRADIAPWRNREICRALSEFTTRIKQEINNANDDRKS
jgi:DNA-binding transcriptional MerR regulator